MGNSSMIQSGKLLSCATRQFSLISTSIPLASLGYQTQLVRSLVPRLLALLHTQRNGLCALKLALLSPDISTDLAIPTDFASFPLVCLRSAFSHQSPWQLITPQCSHQVWGDQHLPSTAHLHKGFAADRYHWEESTRLARIHFQCTQMCRNKMPWALGRWDKTQKVIQSMSQRQYQCL